MVLVGCGTMGSTQVVSRTKQDPTRMVQQRTGPTMILRARVFVGNSRVYQRVMLCLTIYIYQMATYDMLITAPSIGRDGLPGTPLYL